MTRKACEMYQDYPRYMGKENIVILGDFAPLEKKLSDGAITREDYNRFFTDSRIHGFDKSIRPFAVGGSDAASICGIPGAFSTRKVVAYEKLGLCKPFVSTETQELFDAGHEFEPIVRDLFNAENRKRGLTAYPETRQFVNLKWPHCVANVDGIIEEITYVKQEDGSILQVKRYGVYEGKMTFHGSHAGECFSKSMIPLNYEAQMRFYMEVLDLDFAIICGQTRYYSSSTEKGFGKFFYKRIERDRDYGKKLMDECEAFVLETAKGIFRNKSASAKVLEQELTALYGSGDPYHDAFVMPKSTLTVLTALDKVDKEITSLKESEEYRGYADRLEALREEKEILKLKLKLEMKDAVKATFTDGKDRWEFKYAAREGQFSSSEKSCSWLKENYPDAYYDMIEKFPKNTRVFSYKKIV